MSLSSRNSQGLFLVQQILSARQDKIEVIPEPGCGSKIQTG
jgi:hypothetical protein